MSVPALPNWVLRSLFASVLTLALMSTGMHLGMSVLRQGRLLDRALQVCDSRATAAQEWLAREERLKEAIEREERDALGRMSRLLLTDEAVRVRSRLKNISEANGFDVQNLGLGTLREGEAFDTVPASLRLIGDRVELPPFLAAFYDQPRVVRLVALDLEATRFGSQRVGATLRWELAAPARTPPPLKDLTGQWAPPSLAAPGLVAGISRWNLGRWHRLQDAASALRSLAPALRSLAELEGKRSALEQERRTLTRWAEAAKAERAAVLRKAPLLLRQLDVSALGRAGLRPGPGGTLQIIDDD